VQVYLIRHAQCEINVLLDDAPPNKRLSIAAFNALIRGDAASPLTPEGVAQAQRLAERLTGVQFDRLYTSPLPRAVATAAALSEVAGLTPQIIDDLRELQPPMIRERAGELTLRRLFWRAYTRMLFSPASPDAFGPAYRRARAVWSQITREPAEAIAVVSHGMFIWFLLLSLWTDRRWRVLSRDLTNCGISLVALRR
jgi:broad specificity phosphatase PhoE